MAQRIWAQTTAGLLSLMLLISGTSALAADGSHAALASNKPEKREMQGKAQPKDRAGVSDFVQAYLRANVRSILYHELGHAVIDQFSLAIYGQEEDAADVFSVLMIDRLHLSKEANEIARMSALTYKAEAIEMREAGEEEDFSGLHGGNMQRYYTQICLHVGADYLSRRIFGRTLGLPKYRMETCVEERSMAGRAWRPVFVRLQQEKEPLVSFESHEPAKTAEQDYYLASIKDEVKRLNARFGIEKTVALHVKHCGEVNAFYHPRNGSIVMCYEFADYLADQARLIE